jgi:hypothetical protein
MSPAIEAWLSAFAFTQIVEVPIYVAAIRRALRGDDLPRLRGVPAQLAVAFGASLVTHPIVWFLIPRLRYDAYWVMVARAETFAVVVEGFYFYALYVFDLRRAMLWSLAANATSASLGLLSRWLFGWP